MENVQTTNETINRFNRDVEVAKMVGMMILFLLILFFVPGEF